MRVAGMVGKFATANSPRAFETVLSSTARFRNSRPGAVGDDTVNGVNAR